MMHWTEKLQTELNDARSKEILADHDLIRQAIVTEILSFRYGNNPNPVTRGTKIGDRQSGPHPSQTQAVFEDMEVDPVSPSSPTGGDRHRIRGRNRPVPARAGEQMHESAFEEDHSLVRSYLVCIFFFFLITHFSLMETLVHQTQCLRSPMILVSFWLRDIGSSFLLSN
jgi:hypothetical protein